MSTQPSALEEALAGVPTNFRRRILDTHRDLKIAFRRREYDACGLRAGKLCETLLRFIQHELGLAVTPFGEKLPDVAELCRQLERTPKASGPESLRVLLPRAISFVYTLRNKRAIGHVGGDIDANEIDAATMVRALDWCLSELIRMEHKLPLEEAQALLDALAERELPLVWSVAGVKRVLDPTMKRVDQVLVLLYSELDTAVPIEDLARWVEARRLPEFVNRIVLPCHQKRLLEYDRSTETAILLPPGADRAEALLADLPS